MPYLFPARVLKTGDVTDPDEVNKDTQPVAEKWSGRVNEHDLDAGDTSVNMTVDPDAFYTPYYKSVSSDPHFGSPAGFTLPDTAHAAAWVLPNDFEWHRVGTDPNDMIIEATTGVSTLWIIGWVQYIWMPFAGAGAHLSGGTKPARVQFALRVDGRLIEDTVTGKNDPFEKAFWAIQAVNQRNNPAGTPFPGPAVPRTETPTGCGMEMRPIRIGINFNVDPGAHTVEIVARRVPGLKHDSYDATDEIAVFSRRLLVVDIHKLPPTIAGAASTSVTPLSPEDALSTTSLGTDRVFKLRDVYNTAAGGGLEEGSLARGALNHGHLPDSIADVATFDIVPVGILGTDDYYPGYDVSTNAPASPGNTGWWGVNDGATNLSTFPDHPAAFPVSTEYFYIVLANVRINQVDPVGVGLGNDDRLDAFGALALAAWTDLGAGPVFDIIGETEAYFNSYLWWANLNGGPLKLPDEIDIPLFWCWDMSAGVPLGATVPYFAVYASNIGYPGGARNIISWGQGNIIVIVLRR